MKVNCQSCAGHLECKESMLGATVQCPLCGAFTKLLEDNAPLPPHPLPSQQRSLHPALNEPSRPDARILIYFNEFPKDSHWGVVFGICSALSLLGGVITMNGLALGIGFGLMFASTVIDMGANVRWLLGQILQELTKPKSK